jgi:Family of unknown function (DUF5678)
MSEITFEDLLTQIAKLRVADKVRLFTALGEQIRSATPPNPEGRFVEPIPEPDPEPNRRWMAAHRHEYAGQWVALDGERLIAHGMNAKEVFAAARADGAYLPLVTFILPDDAAPFVGI